MVDSVKILLYRIFLYIERTSASPSSDNHVQHKLNVPHTITDFANINAEVAKSIHSEFQTQDLKDTNHSYAIYAKEESKQGKVKRRQG